METGKNLQVGGYMETLTIDLKKKNSFEIGQQGDHNVLCVHFINMKNVGANKKYIYYVIDDIEKIVPLTNDRFIVGYPLTTRSGAVTAQIISKLDDNTIIRLSKVFTMNILSSRAFIDNGDYPVDPNIQSMYDLLDDLINRFNAININEYSTLMSQLNQSVNAASNSAAEAEASATNASASANAASNSVAEAKASATNAAASAQALANLGLYMNEEGYIVQDVDE